MRRRGFRKHVKRFIKRSFRRSFGRGRKRRGRKVYVKVSRGGIQL